MVGEIRDLETAQIAVQASPHRPPGALDAAHQHRGRRRSRACATWAIEPFLLSSSLIGVLAQRLVRVLSPDSTQPLRGRGI